MELKKVCVLLFGIAFFILLNGINCIANQEYEKNYITEDERRGADIPPTDQNKSDSHKRGLYVAPTGHGSKTHSYSSGYGGSGISSGGYGAPYPSSHGFSSYDSEHGATGIGYSHGHSGGGYGYSGHGPSGGGYSGHGPSGGGGYGGHVGHGGGGGGHSSYALKGLLIPLAGIALLGAAAALTTNPVLLQLGVVNGRRRKRSLKPQDFQRVYPQNPHVRPERN